VLDPQPPRGGIRTASGKSRFAELDPSTSAGPAQATVRAALLLAAEAGDAGLPSAALTARLGLLTDEAMRPVELLSERGALVEIGAVLVTPSHVDGIGRTLLDLAGAYHREHPTEDGIPREEARVRTCGRAAPGLFERVVEDLVRQGRITATDRIGVAGRPTEAGGARKRRARRGRVALSRGWPSPPTRAALAEALGMPPAWCRTSCRGSAPEDPRAHRRARLPRGGLRQLKDDVISLKQASPGTAVKLDVAGFKDRYGISRKCAIPLLKYLDRERVTRRVGRQPDCDLRPLDSEGGFRTRSRGESGPPHAGDETGPIRACLRPSVVASLKFLIARPMPRQGPAGGWRRTPG
jgi:selenocysteine-specific elongation factor